MNFIVTLLILIFILGLIVFIHELGHFLAAKKSGVYVEEFSIGMGPKIWTSKKKKNETQYSLRLFPIGGFVAMANTEEFSKKIRKEQILENKSFIQRFLVLIMGIIFNFVLTVILLFLNGLMYGSPDTRAILGEIIPDSSSFQAGLQQGDIITHVNDIKTNTWDDVLLEINVKKDIENYKFTILRDNHNITTIVTPKLEANEEGEVKKVFGFALGNSKKYGFVEAVKYSLSGTINMSRSLFVILGNLFSGNISANSLSGPVGIFSVINQVKETGLENVIYLIAYLSINVGVINLIPVPVFDGGRILLLIIEKVIRKRIPEKVESILNLIGFILLIALMIYVTFNDIFKLF